MNARFLLTLLLAALAGRPAAQQQDAFVVHDTYSINSRTSLYEMDHRGQVVRTLVTLPVGLAPKDIVMGDDNTTYRVLAHDIASSRIWVMDVTTNGAIVSVANWTGSIPAVILRTDDGDWLIVGQLMAQRPLTGVYRLSGTTVTTMPTGWGIAGYAGTWDPDTGDIVVRGRGPDAYGTTLWGYYRIDRVTGAISTIAAYPEKGLWPAAVGARHPPWEGVPGTFVDMIWDGQALSSFLAHVHPERGALSVSAIFPSIQVSDMVETNPRNLPVQYVAVVQNAPIPAAFYLAYFTGDGLPVALHHIPSTPALISGTRMLRIGGRHLTWFMDRPPNGRSLRLDFPGERGRAYVVAFGMRGTRPGVRLGDGRHVPLNPDGLVMASAQGGIGAVLTGTVGFLDPLGRARVTVDTSGAGNALKGVRLWAVALLLDPRSPAGFSHIVGPIVLNIKS
ncbi:MAG: hypothetical protein JXQ29_04475 [Planctomycetes bacterium]|nr:hypothetical protein [Planctomycetota bacterium]